MSDLRYNDLEKEERVDEFFSHEYFDELLSESEFEENEFEEIVSHYGNFAF